MDCKIMDNIRACILFECLWDGFYELQTQGPIVWT